MPTSKSRSKTIAITVGDPAGIGPEIVRKALAKKSIQQLARFIVLGETQKKSAFKTGKISHEAGAASLHSLDLAIDLIKRKQADAIVTAPVCKEAIGLTHKNFHGHTEYLAAQFNVKQVDMMFVTPRLKTVIVTRHVPVSQISRHLNSKNIYDTITLTHASLQKYFHYKNPRIGICGLNPHAGEGGTIGTDELVKIIPALTKARHKGIQVFGPFAADTLFIPKNREKFDAIIAMYHDQGLIPVKTLYYPKLVNLTIGLPFIRTSPAHGTAFDIAGQNKADETSLCEAIRLAAQLS